MLISYIILSNLITITFGSLCIYNNHGKIKFDKLDVKDIRSVYSEYEFFFDNPFYTYYGNCTDEENLVNIYGIPAKRKIVSRKRKREEKKEYEKFDLSDGRTCNLLTSVSPEANPYNEELTGMVNAPNFLKGWKLIDITTQSLGVGGSSSLSYTVNFDESYSISVQETHGTSDVYTIENHSDQNSSSSFSKTISEIVEEALSNSIQEDEAKTWDEQIVKDITKVNEKHTENTWNHEENDSNSDGTQNTSDNGSTSNKGSSSSDNTGSHSDETSGLNGGVSIGVPFFSVNGGGEKSTSKGTSHDVNITNSRDRGTTHNKSTGTTTDHTVGKSDSTGNSRGESDSVSESESTTKSNGGSRSVMNAIERSKSTSRGNDETETREIGNTSGKSESQSTSNDYSKTEGTDKTTSQGVSYTFEESVVNNGNTPCQVLIYKKITRNYQIASCYDYNDKTRSNINTRSIVNIDIDDDAVTHMMDQVFDSKLIKDKNYKSLLLDCKGNTDDYHFELEDSEFTNIYSSLRPSAPKTRTFDYFLETGQKIGTDQNIKKISSLAGEYSTGHALELYMNKDNDLVFGNNDVEYFNTQTSYAKSKAYFKISNLNHLEVLTEETMFEPVGTYAEEFNGVNYMENPDLPDFDPNNIRPDPNDKPKEVSKVTEYLKHLEKDNIDINFIKSKDDVFCKDALWFCNCQNPTKNKDNKCIVNHVTVKSDNKLFNAFKSELRNSNTCQDKKNRNNIYYSQDEIDFICSEKMNEKPSSSSSDNGETGNSGTVDCTILDKCESLMDSSIVEAIEDYMLLNCDQIKSKCRMTQNSIQKINEAQSQEKSQNGNATTDNGTQGNGSSQTTTETSTTTTTTTTSSSPSPSDTSKVNSKIKSYIENLTNKNKFKTKNVVLWSNIKPEHQHLIVGWNGNGLSTVPETSYLVVSTFDQNRYNTYDGLTLYDPLGVPIWRYKIKANEYSSYLDRDGYYLPVKYGYPFKNEDVTKNIPEKYLYEAINPSIKKNNSYLQLPDGIAYKGNFMYFGGCNNTIYSNEGLKSENKRFHLILNSSGNLVFKDNNVTIWESKTANLWQGKGPYKLIVGRDGVMRILNKFDYVIMSTLNDPEKDNKHLYRRYRLEVLNAGTFRIVNENGEEVWNMWNHAPYHEFLIYKEHEFYNACEAEARNPNLPFLTTYKSENKISGFDNSIIRVGEQIINRYTEDAYEELRKSKEYRDLEISNEVDLESSKDNYIFDENDNYYSTAVMPLTSFHLKYQNLLQKFEKVDDKNIVIDDSYIDLKPITDRNSRIVYGKLNDNGVFNIYDCNDHVLFTTGIEGETCKDSKVCYYIMYITPDTNGYIRILKRKFDNKNNPTDTLIWTFPPTKKLTEMISDNEEHYLTNLEALIYRDDTKRDKDCEEEKKQKEDTLKGIFGKDNNDYEFILKKDESYCLDALWYCKCKGDPSPTQCRKEHVKIQANANKYKVFKDELNENHFYNKTLSYNISVDQINSICKVNKNSKCKIINEFPCVTLRTKGVYFYGDKEPYFPYEINTESKLQLDKKTGYLTLDDQNVLDLEDENLALPTKLRCNINSDKYGVVLLDNTNSVVWEYPSRIIYSITNEPYSNSMVVDRSIYYKNDKNENVARLTFKAEGLFNSTGDLITEKYDSKIKGRTLYLDDQQLYIQDINDQKIEGTTITIYNPDKHAIELRCKDENNIEIFDKVSKDVIWNYPTQQFKALIANTATHQLRPMQELIPDETDSNGKFCLKINKGRLINVNTKDSLLKNAEEVATEDSANPKVDPEDEEDIDVLENVNDNIEYLDVVETGVYVYFSNGTSINLIDDREITPANMKNEKHTYSVRCETIYGDLKAAIYRDDKRIMTLPKYSKKYEISESKPLFYGESLFNKETGERCLFFEDGELFTQFNHGNITIYKMENYKKEKTDTESSNKEKMNKQMADNYVKVKSSDEFGLFFNQGTVIDKVNNLSGNDQLIGKCMNYHGGNKFVLYSPNKEKVYLEYPKVEKRTSLEKDEIIYDMIYVDDKFKKPCIRIDEIMDENGKSVMDSNGKKKIGLFFSDQTKPIPMDAEVSELIDNNNLKFNQYEGKLLLNDVNVFNNAFTSDLILKCIFERNKVMYAVINDEEGNEYWRYPALEKKQILSTRENYDEETRIYAPDNLYVGELLYNSAFQECFKLTEKGIQFNYNNHTYYEPDKGKGLNNKLRYINFQKEKDTFNLVYTLDGDNTYITKIPNKVNADYAEIRCDLEYGFYVKDSNGNRLRNMITKTYDANNLFTYDKVLYPGDKIIDKDGTECANISVTDYKFFSYEKVYNLQLNINDMSAPLVINGNSVFQDIPAEYITKPPKSISLRCDQVEANTFLALYDDDNNQIIDKVMDKCREHQNYLLNKKYNNEICLGEENSLNYGTVKCLSYIKKNEKGSFGSDLSIDQETYQLVDHNNHALHSYKEQEKIYLDIATGNFMVSNRQTVKPLVSIGKPNVTMICNSNDEILIAEENNTENVFWKYRPYIESRCKNGLVSKGNDAECNTIYKLETIGNFKIDTTNFYRFYDDNISSLQIATNGTLISNGDEILIEDEWNLNRVYNYGITCIENDIQINFNNNYKSDKNPNLNCRFKNLDTEEVIQNFNKDTVGNGLIAGDIFYLGHRIMCSHVGLVLTKEGFKYRSIDKNDPKNKKEILFKGEVSYYAISETEKIAHAKFDENYDFVIQYMDQSNSLTDTATVVSYENSFENEDTEDDISSFSAFNKKKDKKEVGLTCTENRLQFYEIYKNEKKVYFSYPPQAPDKVKRVYIYEKDTNKCLYVNERSSDKSIRANGLCNGDLFLWEIPYSGKGIWRNVGSNTYISSNRNGIVNTDSDITNSSVMNDITKLDIKKPYSLGCFHLTTSNKYESDSTVKNNECTRYGDAGRWILSEKPPVKTKRVYIYNSVTKGCLYAVGKSSNEVKIDNKCDGNSYLWEIPENGSGLWKNVETGQFLRKSSDDKLMITSYFYDSNVLNIADPSKSKYGFWIEGFEKDCLYPTNELQKCDSSNPKHVWMFSSYKPLLADTQKVYIINNQNGLGCLSVNSSGKLSVSLNNKCNGNEFIWEIAKSGNGLLKNVGSGKYLIKSSNNQIGLSSDASNTNMAIISKNDKFGFWMNDDKTECLYVDKNSSISYSTCNENDNKYKWIISYDVPDIYEVHTFRSKYDKGHKEYLGVKNIESQDRFKLSSSVKYYSWLMTSSNSKSTWYLSNATNGGNGNKSDYCLDVNLSSKDGYERRLKITQCKNAKAKFKYGGRYERNIYVYYDGNEKCVDFYDDSTLKVRDCEDSSPSGNTSFGWEDNYIGQRFYYTLEPKK